MSNSPVANSVIWETTACPLCGEDRSQHCLSASNLLYGFPGEFTLTRCDSCDHVFMNPRPSRATIGLCYPTDYGPFREASDRKINEPQQPEDRSIQNDGDRSGPPHGASWMSPRTWPWLKRLVLWWIDSRAAPIPSVIGETRLGLELGCAHGAFLKQLRERGWKCIGVEPAAEVAGRAAAKGFDVRVGSLDEADLPREHFDAVFAWMVVEHLHDPVGTLRLARELLKPGGWLLFSVPNFGCWEHHIFGRYCYGLADVTHLQQFTPLTVRRLLEASGVELVELIYQRNINNIVGSIGLWLRAKFPRWSLGERLICWIDNPTAFGLCLLVPLARCLSMLRQGGRLTVIARRPIQ